MGCLWQRGRIWWVKYYINGRPVRESTKTEKQTEAKRFLKEREGRAAGGQPILPRADRIRYEEIATDLLRHYATTGERNLDEAGDRFKPLAAFFNGRRVVAINGALAEEYVQGRQTEGVANSTINKELFMLTKMLRLAYEHGKCLRLPVIHKLKEASPRSGFFEPADFETVRRHLPPDLQVAICIGYTYGWRIQSEVLKLTTAQVDLSASTLRLDPGTTKNDEGRLVYLTPEIGTLIAAQVERVRALGRKLDRIVPHLFPHLNGRHQGQRITEFNKRWHTACVTAGLGMYLNVSGCAKKYRRYRGLLLHDLRRSGVRNMVNNGVSERVAMQVTGHRTRSVFDRYHIVSPADLKEAARKMTGTIWAQQPSTALDSAR